jgi:hypothetical protein
MRRGDGVESETDRRPRARRTLLWALGLAPLVLAGGGGLAWLTSPADRPPHPRPAGARRETRPTLEPALYTGKARRAHEVAREIPDVLDQLKCYCRCEAMGHVSLLSCYTDGHAAT